MGVLHSLQLGSLQLAKGLQKTIAFYHDFLKKSERLLKEKQRLEALLVSQAAERERTAASKRREPPREEQRSSAKRVNAINQFLVPREKSERPKREFFLWRSAGSFVVQRPRQAADSFRMEDFPQARLLCTERPRLVRFEDGLEYQKEYFGRCELP